MLGETFWAKAYGQCLDKYGFAWMVNVRKSYA